MSKHLIREEILDRAIVRETPVNSQEVNRTFEMPRALYAITVGLYLGFLAIAAVGFSSPGLILPIAICFVFVIAGFGVPAIWARLAPETKSKAQTFGQFKHSGIQTFTGRLSGKDAMVQMLILPVLIVMWGLATVTIAALV